MIRDSQKMPVFCFKFVCDLWFVSVIYPKKNAAVLKMRFYLLNFS